MRVSRYWLALLYVLATVLAQGVHDHGCAGGEDSSRHEAGCDDPRPHIAGHWSPDLSHDQDHCLACQFRANHHSWLFSPPASHTPVLTTWEHASAPDSPTLCFRRNTCRAPPTLGTA